jgi:hypothetical protein
VLNSIIPEANFLEPFDFEKKIELRGIPLAVRGRKANRTKGEHITVPAHHQRNNIAFG